MPAWLGPLLAAPVYASTGDLEVQLHCVLWSGAELPAVTKYPLPITECLALPAVVMQWLMGTITPRGALGSRKII